MTSHPSADIKWHEDTRINTITQIAVLVCSLLWLAFAAPAQAEDVPSAAISVLPADGRPRGIELRAQTVDAVIREEGGAVWAETRTWVYLYNPGQAQIVLPVVLPGPQPAPAPLPGALQVTLNNKPLTLTTLPPSDDQPQVRVTTPVTAPGRSAVALRISYRQALPATGGAATFIYPLTATAGWGGRPESLRVTVRFDPPAGTGQILGFTPEAYRRTDAALTWHWENTKATADIGVTFITPVQWAELEAARRAAEGGAGLAAQEVLAEHYWRLAALTPPAFQTGDYFQRFFPRAVAALQGGLAQAGAGAERAALAAAHVRLAEFYREAAQRAGDQPRTAQAAAGADTYLQLAAAELAAALALDPVNEPARLAAAGLHRQLMVGAQARGNPLAAQEHEVRLKALDAGAGLPTGQALAQAAALARAEQAVAQGDLAAAEAWTAEAFGAEAVIWPGGGAPRAQQVLAAVTTGRAGRRIEAQVTGETGRSEGLLAQAAHALAGIGQVEVGQGHLMLTLAYSDAAARLARQAEAAEALAGIPELALLGDILRPARQEWQVAAQPFLVLERYHEAADLRPAQALWEAHAQRLEAAAAEAAATAGSDPAARLARVQAALWARDAAAWRELAERSRATYRVTLETRAQARVWEVAAGDARDLQAEARVWREDRLAWAAGGTALVLALMVFAVWRAIMGRWGWWGTA